MRLKQILLPVVFLFMLAAGAGCKKTETATKNFAISELTDTAGNYITRFTYTASGKILQMYSPTTSYDFLYSGNKLVTRTFTAANVNIVDSFFYDLSDRVYRVVEYDMMAAVKLKTTVFIFNADNTINSATVDYASVFTDDEIFELTYANGKYSGWRSLVNRSGSYYQPIYKFEFLAYDDKPNPLAKIYREGLMDKVETPAYFSASPNNFTSAKQTNYDLTTQQVNNIIGSSAAYTYNADGLPVSVTILSGSSTTTMLMQYVQL